MKLSALVLLLSLVQLGVCQLECPDNWVNAGDIGCYRFLEDKVNQTWLEARQSCESQGGYLAEPKTSEQSEFLHGFALVVEEFTNIQNWWLGCSDLGKEGDWYWMYSMSQLSDSAWAPNRPSNRTANSDDCCVMVLHGSSFQWEDTSCTSGFVHGRAVAPICEVDPLGSSTTTTSPSTVNTTMAINTTTPLPFVCNSGNVFNGYCYQFSDGKVDWHTAEQNCVQDGGHLVSFHSTEETNYVRNNLNNSYNFWLGANDNANEGIWHWSDGSPFNYTYWYGSEPNGSGDCAYGYYSYSNQWVDTDCSTSYNYICKIKMP